MIEKNKNIYLVNWLLLVTLMVALMIVVGGLTRLTDSGLSITKWDLFTGIIPPLTVEKWEYFFSLYKLIPEFTQINSLMTLSEFKIIFWWEYIHRLLGRLIGLFYLIPLIYFTYKKNLNGKEIISLYSIFILICVQGVIGWYMVKSGLTERTDVSHYRLSIHLTIAFVIFILLLWNYFKFSKKKVIFTNKSLPLNLPVVFTFILLFQILIGALVSGLDAGKIYQTWPLMNYSYFPDDSKFVDLQNLNLFNNPSILQFLHRNIAYLVFFIYLIILFIINNNFLYNHLRKASLFVLAALLIQIVLGILTILSGAQILLASLHQIGSIVLIYTAINLVYINKSN